MSLAPILSRRTGRDVGKGKEVCDWEADGSGLKFDWKKSHASAAVKRKGAVRTEAAVKVEGAVKTQKAVKTEGDRLTMFSSSTISTSTFNLSPA